jgi:hypothetical protein
MHALPHRLLPGGQVQAPLKQVAPVPQAMPQPPQLASSESVFTHEPPQFFSPGAHCVQSPPLHACVEPQALVQVPQWAGSFPRSTQVPLQSVRPLAHRHDPAMQSLPPVHALPHVPQLAASDFVSTQAAPHASSGAPQDAAPPVPPVPLDVLVVALPPVFPVTPPVPLVLPPVLPVCVEPPFPPLFVVVPPLLPPHPTAVIRLPASSDTPRNPKRKVLKVMPSVLRCLADPAWVCRLPSSITSVHPAERRR